MKKKLEEGRRVMIDFAKLEKIYEKIIKKGRERVIPVIVQDYFTKEIYMLAYTNKKAFEYTLKEKIAAFWSTSRNELWVKGKNSGSFIEVMEIWVNCEQNSILYLGRPYAGGACHTKNKEGEFRKSCFYRKVKRDGKKLKFADSKGGI